MLASCREQSFKLENMPLYHQGAPSYDVIQIVNDFHAATGTSQHSLNNSLYLTALEQSSEADVRRAMRAALEVT